MNQTSRPSFSIAEVVPHKATMSLLDEVVDYGEDWIKTKLVITEDSVFVTDKGVPSWIGIEYMAQSVAAFAGLRRRLKGLDAVIGFLVGMRKYSCSHSYFSIGSELIVTITMDFESDNGLGAFKCKIIGSNKQEDCSQETDAEFIEASSNINVFEPHDVDEFLASHG